MAQATSSEDILLKFVQSKGLHLLQVFLGAARAHPDQPLLSQVPGACDG